jgi:hypothetical protein
MSADTLFPHLKEDSAYTHIKASKPCTVEFYSPLYRLLKTHKFGSENLSLVLEEVEGPVGRMKIKWEPGTPNPRLTLVEDVPDVTTHTGVLEHNISDACLEGDHTGQRLRAMRVLADGTRHPCCTDCMPYQTNTQRGTTLPLF